MAYFLIAEGSRSFKLYWQILLISSLHLFLIYFNVLYFPRCTSCKFTSSLNCFWRLSTSNPKQIKFHGPFERKCIPLFYLKSSWEICIIFLWALHKSAIDCRHFKKMQKVNMIQKFVVPNRNNREEEDIKIF